MCFFSWPWVCVFAEACSLLKCLELCVDINYFPDIVEVDSNILVGFLKDLFTVPWKLVYMIRRCKRIMKENVTIVHTLREGNTLADCLSKHGHIYEDPWIGICEGDLLDCCRNLAMLDKHENMTFRP